MITAKEIMKSYGPNVTITTSQDKQEFTVRTPHSRIFLGERFGFASKAAFEKALYDRILAISAIYGFVTRQDLFRACIRTDETRRTWVVKATGVLTGKDYYRAYTIVSGKIISDQSSDPAMKWELYGKRKESPFKVEESTWDIRNPIFLDDNTLIIPSTAMTPAYSMCGYDPERKVTFMASHSEYYEYLVDEESKSIIPQGKSVPAWFEEFKDGDPYGYSPRNSPSLKKAMGQCNVSAPVYEGRYIYISAGHTLWVRLPGGWIELAKSLQNAEQDLKAIGGEQLDEYYLVKNLY